MQILGWIFGLLGAVTMAAQFISLAVVWRRARSADEGRGAAVAATRSVSILRPVCGLENHLEATLRSSFALAHPDYEVIFCVASATDPVVPLVEQLIAAHPRIPSRLLVGDERISINPKLNNLVKGWAAARHDWIVMADSNVLLPPDFLDRLFERWTAGVGLVSSPPTTSRPDGFAAELECAFVNSYQARWQLTADELGHGFAHGKTMVFSRRLLDRAGGLPALAREPAEDAAATKAIRSIGLTVRLVRSPFRQPLGRRSLTDVWQRQIRWARLRRVTFKALFVPELASGALLPILAGGCLGVAAGLPYALVLPVGLAWYGGEGLVCRAYGWPLSWRSPLAWIARDILIPFIWVAAWIGGDFIWRGNDMRVGSDGTPGTRRTPARRAWARGKAVVRRVRTSIASSSARSRRAEGG